MRFLIFIIFLLSCESILAKPIINEHELTYSIQGHSGEALRSEMNHHGPQGEAQYHASTEWHVIWHYRLHESANFCQIVAPEILVVINYHFPEWKNYSESTTLLQTRWNATLKQLRAHEFEHGQNGKYAGFAIEKVLLQLPALPNCELLQASVKAKTENIIQYYQKKDVELDKKTHHVMLS